MTLLRCCSWILILCLLGAGVLVPPVSAQSANTTYNAPVVPSDSSDDSSVSDALLVGFAVALVGILLWLGWKADQRHRGMRYGDTNEDSHEAWVRSLNEDEPAASSVAYQPAVDPPAWRISF